MRRKGGGLGASKPKKESPKQQTVKQRKTVSFPEDPVSEVRNMSPQEKLEYYKKNRTISTRRRVPADKNRSQKIRQRAINNYNVRQYELDRQQYLNDFRLGKVKGGKRRTGRKTRRKTRQRGGKISNDEFDKITMDITNLINIGDIDEAYNMFISNKEQLDRCETLLEKTKMVMSDKTKTCKKNKSTEYGKRADQGAVLSKHVEDPEKIEVLREVAQLWKDKHDEKYNQ